MIQDAVALAEIQRNWGGVEALRSRLQASAFASAGIGRSAFPFALADAAHNLPFVHSYAILNDVLKQLADEGVFSCRSIFLGPLLKASELIISWQDFALISSGLRERNDVAHRGHLLGRGDCWKYMDAVKHELVSWRVL